MANVTRDLAFSKYAYANQLAPNTATVPSTGTWYSIGSGSEYKSEKVFYLGGLAAWPTSLKRNNIISAQLRVCVIAGDWAISFETVKGNFTPSSVTWKNQPAKGSSYAYGLEFISDLGISAGYTGDIWIEVDDRYHGIEDIVNLIKDGGVELYGENLNGASGWRTRNTLSGGGAPFLRITYSDSDILHSQVKIRYPLSGTINPEIANQLSWTLQRREDNIFCYDETFTQTSAKVFWKATTESNWHTINISGATMSYTFPAFTFPTGKTVQYYVQATDADGTTSTTSTYNITIPASQITPQNSPVSGYRNPRENISFSWYFKHPNGSYPQQSAKLCWRVAGTETWNEIAASGSTTSVTVPGSAETQTFPIASTIEWYLYGVDSSGSSSQTSVYSFSTTAATAYATVNSPSGNVEDGSAPITFRWTLTSADGLQMSQVDLWWKTPEEDNQHWHTIIQSTDIISEYTVPGGYFPAGEIQWLVHAFNIDGTRGPDSITSFICVSAPDPVQGLVATPVPLTTISWQSEGQEAYEISIDGAVVRKAYGVGVYSWKVPEPLADGEHVITVRIQGIYGLWSQPTETSISVQNVPELQEIDLTGRFDIDARLVAIIPGLETAPELHWYRDGKYIALTSGTMNYLDRFVLGSHSYHVEIWHASGNYTRSNAVTGFLCTDSPKIAPLSGGAWFDMRLTESSDNTQEFTWSKTTARTHVQGAVYPILETSPFEDMAGTFSCSFPDETEARKFEALRGQTVILKNRRGQVIIGALAQFQKTVRLFFTTYRFQIQQIDWEDFVSYDEGS